MSGAPHVRWWRTARTIAAADLGRELRRPVAISGVVLFSVGALVISHLAVAGSGSLDGRVAAGTLWIVLLFGAILATGQGMSSERENGTWDALLLAPADRSAVFAGKWLGSLAVCLALHGLVLAAFFAVFRAPTDAPAAGMLIGTIVLADVGLTAIGIILGVVSFAARGRELVVMAAFLPLSMPAVVVATSTALFAFGETASTDAHELLFLAAYDAVFIALGLGVLPEIATE
jgi:heme exporter protein B